MRICFGAYMHDEDLAEWSGIKLCFELPLQGQGVKFVTFGVSFRIVRVIKAADLPAIFMERQVRHIAVNPIDGSRWIWTVVLTRSS